jgi:putative FmdB family regulatory protein
MPIYDYLCKHCNYRVNDRIQQFNEQDLSKCPSCGNPIEKLINGKRGLKFNCSGFYSTDYKDKGK